MPFFGAAQSLDVAGYCEPCAVWGAKDNPCWCCGGTELRVGYPPIAGFRYDPTQMKVDVIGVSVAVDGG